MNFFSKDTGTERRDKILSDGKDSSPPDTGSSIKDKKKSHMVVLKTVGEEEVQKGGRAASNSRRGEKHAPGT